MYWEIFNTLVLALSPIVPVNPRLKRPNPAKNFWTFECDSFTSAWQVLKTSKVMRYIKL